MPASISTYYILRMDNPLSTESNTAWFRKRIEAGNPFEIPPGTLFVDMTEGPAVTPSTVGCGRIKSDGSMGIGLYEYDNPNLGNKARIENLGTGSILRLTGNGFMCDTVDFIQTDGVSPAIEVEGRGGILMPTGRHHFRDCVFENCGSWFKSLGGYYEEDGDFVADWNHSDNCVVDHCEGYDCLRIFLSENPQALNWKFRDCRINGDVAPAIAADLVLGGSVTFDGLVINCLECTIFKVYTFSPNNNMLVCRNFWRDRAISNPNSLTVFEFAGIAGQATYIPDWLDALEVTGFIPIEGTDWDATQLYIDRGDPYTPSPAPPNVNLTISGTATP